MPNYISKGGRYFKLSDDPMIALDQQAKYKLLSASQIKDEGELSELDPYTLEEI